MIYLQRDDPRLKAKVLKWLRCEDLSPHDRAAVGELVPRTHEEHPIQMVAQIGRLMAAVQAAPLVVCVDQLEDMFQQESGAEASERWWTRSSRWSTASRPRSSCSPAWRIITRPTASI